MNAIVGRGLESRTTGQMASQSKFTEPVLSSEPSQMRPVSGVQKAATSRWKMSPMLQARQHQEYEYHGGTDSSYRYDGEADRMGHERNFKPIVSRYSQKQRLHFASTSPHHRGNGGNGVSRISSMIANSPTTALRTL